MRALCAAPTPGRTGASSAGCTNWPWMKMRARDIRDVHRLLRVLRAADGAHAGAEAAALVARDAGAVVAEGGGATLEHAAVPAIDVVGDRPDAELRLDALKVGAEVGLACAR